MNHGDSLCTVRRQGRAPPSVVPSTLRVWSWFSRFLFVSENMDSSVSRVSGPTSPHTPDSVRSRSVLTVPTLHGGWVSENLERLPSSVVSTRTGLRRGRRPGPNGRYVWRSFGDPMSEGNPGPWENSYPTPRRLVGRVRVGEMFHTQSLPCECPGTDHRDPPAGTDHHDPPVGTCAPRDPSDSTVG